MPYGIHSASEMCQQRIGQIIENIEGAKNSQDDIIIWEHWEILQCLCTIWLNTVTIFFDSSGSLWGFKRDDAVNNTDVTNNVNSPAFKYKASLITDTEGVKIAVPLKYLSNFWRLLEMPLINCEVKLSLRWREKCDLTTAAIGADANVTGTDSATLK